MTIVLFIIILSVLVFVHEAGHFFAARKAGVRVEEFGFGFPPRLWGRQRGGTIFSINAIPFGGFVRLAGEQNTTDTGPDTFAAASFGKKFAILAAGVVMNYILAWILLSTVLMAGVTIDHRDRPTNTYARLEQQQVRALVSASGAADKAGLQPDDAIQTINGQKYIATEEIVAYAQANNYPPLKIEVVRDNKPVTLNITAAAGPDHPLYGFGIQTIEKLQYPWYVAPWYGLQLTGNYTAQTFQGFGQLLNQLFTTGKVSQDLSGPIGIAVLTGTVSQLGVASVLQFVAILSVSLAVLNFLPIPALDGGRALFVVIERLTGRPINQRLEQTIHAIGFYVLITGVLLISIRDVRRFDLVDKVIGIFQ